MTNNVRPTEEQRQRGIEFGWDGDYLEKGYGIFDFDGLGMLEICAVMDMGTFDSDEDAVQQAERDGVKMIPPTELPPCFERHYYGWIDTPENRKAIAEYTTDRMTDMLKDYEGQPKPVLTKEQIKDLEFFMDGYKYEDLTAQEKEFLSRNYLSGWRLW